MAHSIAPQTLGMALRQSMDLHGPKEAVIEGERSTSYSELDALASQLASSLADRGIGPGHRIAVWLPNSLEWIICQVASAYLGTTLVPINTRLRSREARHILTVSSPSVLIMTRSFMTNDYRKRLLDVAPSLGVKDSLPCDELPSLKHIVSLSKIGLPSVEPWSSVLSASEDQTARFHPNPSVKLADPMLVVWTSGTTSAPKAVVLDHKGLEGIRHWMRHIGYTQDDRTAVNLPLFYIAGNYYGLLSPLLHGGAAILGKELSPRETLDNIERHRATMTLGGPAGYMALWEEQRTEPVDLATLERGYVGGAVITEEQVDIVRERLNVSGLVQVYGMTELHGVVTSTEPYAATEDVARTVGRLMPGYEAAIVDPDSGRELPARTPGEMVVRGRTMLGYLEEGGTLAVHPEEWLRGGWFRTGDLMVEDGEQYAVVGRLKDVIKVGGENVAAAEVEAVLRRHRHVREVAIVALPDEKRGEVPAAVVEFNTESPADMTALAAWCDERLAPFKRPRVFFQMRARDGWPTNVSHKVDKKRLQDMIEAAGAETDSGDVPLSKPHRPQS